MSTDAYDNFDTANLSVSGRGLPVGGSWHYSGSAFADDFVIGPDHEPVPIVDRRGAEPVKVGDAVVFTDEEGVRFEGVVAPGILYDGFGAQSFSINTQTKETRMAKTKVTISAGERRGGGMFAGGVTPFAEVAIEADAAMPVADLQTLVANGQAAVGPVAAAAGIVAYEPTPQDVITDKAPEPETRSVDEPEERLSGLADEELERSNRRMYDAITTAAPNLQEIAKELAGRDDERLQTLAKAISQEVDGLNVARDGS